MEREEERKKERMEDETDLEGAIIDAERRQDAREGEVSDPDAAYQSIAAQQFLKSRGEEYQSLLGITDRTEDARKKLERIFTAIWEEGNPDAYLGSIQKFVLNLARQVGIPGPYERAISQVKEDKGNALDTLEQFIMAVKEDNALLDDSHTAVLEDVRHLKEEKGGYQERMTRAIAQADKTRSLYEHLTKEHALLQEDMEAAKRAGKNALLEAQGIESLKLERDIDETQNSLSKVKLEMEQCTLKIPYLDERITALYKSTDNIDLDLIAHSEYVILLETARDILKESLRHQPEEDLGQAVERYARSGKLIDTIYQNLPAFNVRPRVFAEGKVKRPRRGGTGAPTRSIHDRVRGLLDDISSLTATYQSYQGKRHA